jgi:membrane-bound lytic murein transglycosylase D
MRPGDTLAQVAARYGMTLETLRAVNGIGAGYTVPTGHALLVPALRGSPSESVESFRHAVFTTVPQGRTFYYRVTRGDTMAMIASRYDVSAADIRRWNRLSGEVRPGQKLRITSDRPPRTAARGERAKPALAVRASLRSPKAIGAGVDGGKAVATAQRTSARQRGNGAATVLKAVDPPDKRRRRHPPSPRNYR